jgi:hypothetical protein
MMSVHWMILGLVIMLIVSTPIELEIKNSTDTTMSASYLDLHTELDSEGRVRAKHYDKNIIFTWWTFYLYLTQFHKHLYMKCMSLNWYDIHVVPVMIDFLDRGLQLTRKLQKQGFLVVKLKSPLKNDHGYVPLFVNTFQSFPHSWLITGV